MTIYAARIVILCVPGGEMPSDGYTADIQVHVFSATGYDDAFKKVLAIGYREENEYKNEDGEKVRWIFKEIEEITDLGESIEGKEVSSRMEGYFPNEPLAIDVTFNPEKSYGN